MLYFFDSVIWLFGNAMLVKLYKGIVDSDCKIIEFDIKVPAGPFNSAVISVVN